MASQPDLASSPGSRIQAWRTPLGLFFIGFILLSINFGIMQAAFNNYLHDIHKIGAEGRGFLEFPRELPGFATALVTGILSAFAVRTWAFLSGILSAVGLLGLAWFAPDIPLLVVWVLFWSMADHIMFTVEGVIGVITAREGALGKRLGQVAGLKNLAMILGAGLVWLLMGRWVQGSYSLLLTVAAGTALLSSVFFFKARIANDTGGNRPFVFRRQYSLFYWLNILWGGRKQIFLTFAPWLLISRHEVRPDTLALLLLLASALGVVFRQWFGIAVDRFGERATLLIDAVVMLGICVGFAFSSNLYVLFGLFILDNLMFATRIARTSYLSKIVHDRSDIPASISLGSSLDHALSMTIPAMGGLLWASVGPHAVFLAAAGLAVLTFAAALRVPGKEALKLRPVAPAVTPSTQQ